MCRVCSLGSADLDLRNYKDLEFIGAMGPPGGGRNNVDPRFVRLFTVFNLTPPADEVLKKIYGSIITRYVSNFNEQVQAAATKITPAMLRLFELCIEKLPPTPSKVCGATGVRFLWSVSCTLLCCCGDDPALLPGHRGLCAGGSWTPFRAALKPSPHPPSPSSP